MNCGELHFLLLINPGLLSSSKRCDQEGLKQDLAMLVAVAEELF